MKIGNFIQIAVLPEIQWEEKFNFSKNIGSDFVELMIDYPNGPFTLNNRNIDKLRKLSKKYNLEIFIHAPFTSNNLSSLSPKLCNLSLQEIFKTLNIAKKLNCKFVTIHEGKRSVFSVISGNIHKSVAIDSFKKISRQAERLRIIVGLETLSKSISLYANWIYDPTEMLKIIKTVNSDFFKITFDIGHALTIKDPVEYFLEVKDYVSHIHCHDTDGKEEHIEIGKGKIQFTQFFKMLKKIQYNMSLSLEVIGDREIEMSKKKLDKIIDSI